MTVMNHDPLADLEAIPTADPREAPAEPGPRAQAEIIPAPEAAAAPATPQDADPEAPIKLGETLGIQDVKGAWHDWRHHLERRGVPLAMDPARLQEIDGAGLQLLCMLSSRRPLRWTAPCPPLQDAARRFGVAAALDLEVTP